jgi:hypothetical protein
VNPATSPGVVVALSVARRWGFTTNKQKVEVTPKNLQDFVSVSQNC